MNPLLQFYIQFPELVPYKIVIDQWFSSTDNEDKFKNIPEIIKDNEHILSLILFRYPKTIQFIPNQTVKLCFISMDRMDFSRVNDINDFSGWIKIVNSASGLDELTASLIQKQLMIDELSGDPQLMSILKSMTKNCKYLSKLSQEEIYKEIILPFT